MRLTLTVEYEYIGICPPVVIWGDYAFIDLLSR